MQHTEVHCFPTSFAQQRLWFLEQYEPGTGLYNIAAAWRLEGELDVGALSDAVQALVQRHEALRTSFVAEEDVPVQRIAAQLHIELGVQPLGEDEDEQHWLQRQAQAPFDLEQGPLLRTQLLRLGPQQHVFALTVHHIVADGWSMGVLMRELAELYAARRQGREPALQPLAIQYADFAVWQRQWLQGEVLQQQLEHWKQTLQGASALLALPTDRPRPAVLTPRGASLQFELPASLSRRLRELSRQQGTSLFMTMAAAFNVLLQRYSRQDDICIGYPMANRNRAELEGLIGLFVNTLVLRTTLNPRHSFEALLKQVREAVLDADAYQDLPFEKLVEELRPERNLNHSPLFQVMLALNNTGAEALELHGLRVRPMQGTTATAKFDLTLELLERQGRLLGGFEYNTDLFDRSTIERMVGHYRVLLEAVVADPQTRLKDLPLLTPAERHQLLVQWNDTKAEYPSDKCIHELFEQQVTKTSDAVAVVFEDQQLSYGELNARSNQLAHYLRELGVKPDTLVAICVERSLEMVIGLLGILKAGGAYVPLDPEYPQERLAYMLQDSAAAVVLTQTHLVQRLLVGSARLVCLDENSSRIDCQAANNPTSVSLPRHLAYCIYTSGSTGRPKGAMNEHAAVMNRVLWMQQAYHLEPRDRVLQKTPFSFDVSVWEFFLPLLHGATLVMAGPGVHKDPGDLVSAIQRHGITTMHFVPAMMQAFLASIDATQVSTLRRIFSSGEALPAELQHAFFEKLPEVELYNLYGPTETAVDVTHLRCLPCSADKVPIGRPVANTEMYVLDTELRPLPIGVPGELYIGGVQVGRGYLSQPALTAEKFIPNPFGEAGSRMYRTGDLGRYLPDGNIEFLGRLDHQVKIRGFRVELEEIEAALLCSPQVAQAIAVARDDVADDRYLAAYVVPVKSSQPSAQALRTWLAHRLPDYMLPSAWAILDAFPLNSNGKVDRRALPMPDLRASDPAHGYKAPTSAAEQLLADIWARVLNVPRVGINDNFFALGGHSLAATRVIVQARQALGRGISLRQFFQHPTLAQLAASIAVSDQPEYLDEIVRAASTDRIPLTFAQQRLWFLDRYGSGSATYNVPLAWRIDGDLNEAAMSEAFAAVAARHQALRAIVAEDAAGPFQVFSDATALRLECIDLSELGDAAERTSRFLADEAARPFDLRRGPLVRAHLLRLRSRERILSMVFHHIAVDGWALGLVMSELCALYAAGVSNKTIPVGRKRSIDYADYAAWQQRRMHEPALQRQLDYWKRTLSDATPFIELPLDRARPEVPSHRGAGVLFVIEGKLLQGLRRVTRESSVTLFMSLMAAYGVLLFRHTGQHDIVVGYPIANRRRPELEALVGLVANTLVVRMRFEHRDRFDAVLDQVREAVLSADACQDVPFEKIVEELKPPRLQNRSPLFQVMFSLNDEDSGELRLPGLRVEALNVDAGSAKFDLTLAFVERDGKLIGSFEYDSDLFLPETVERLAEGVRLVLEKFVDAPSSRIGDAPVLSRAECTRLLLASSAAQAPGVPSSEFFVTAFEDRAQRAPDDTAIVIGDRALSYGELNSRVNQLARHLRARGVGPETFVGICLERDASLVVAILAVLKAGGIVLNLDMHYPAARTAHILEETCATIAIARSADTANAPTLPAGTIWLDRDEAEIARYDTADLRIAMHPHQAAYCIFTSGSTGRPKGVLVARAELGSHVRTCLDVYGLSPADRVLQFASFNFDASFEQLLVPLAAGSAIHLRPSLKWSHRELVDTICEHRLTVADIPAVHWNSFSEADVERLQGSSLRMLVVGGEAARARPASSSVLRFEVVNAYGPTEAVITASSFATRIVHRAEGGWLPIGRPHVGRRIYVLNDSFALQPDGVIGEIYIAGAGLARGYLNNPALTAERFLPDPFGAPGERMYRTGDLGCRMADGNLRFVGRKDGQVKVRGFRVELGEIESALNEHPLVEDAAVVLARPGGEGSEASIVAYVVKRDQAEPASYWPSVGEYPIYDSLLYRSMTGDEHRNRRYRAAIGASVRGKVVLEIGTGQDAVLARYCVDAGAAKVYAVESDEAAYLKAADLVRREGLSDRIVLIHADARSVQLPEPADACVSELIGTIGGSEGAARIIHDARRLLKSDAVVLPSRCRTRIAAVQLPESLRKERGFRKLPMFYATKLMDEFGPRFEPRICVKNVGSDSLISTDGIFEDLSFTQFDDGEFARQVQLEMTRDGVFDGFLLWLDVEVSPGNVIDNLDQPDSNWLPVFFPLDDAGVAVRKGDRLELHCRSVVSDNGVNPDYHVDGRLTTSLGETRTFSHDSRHHAAGERRSAFLESFFRQGSLVLLADEDPPPLGPSLRLHLEAILPDHMIPARFHALPSLPINPAGKVDRAALLDLGSGQRLRTEAVYVAPRTLLEEMLARIWAEALQLDEIGVHDNFFSLGGHSMVAARTVGRIAEALGIECSLAMLFQFPTVAGLAGQLLVGRHARPASRSFEVLPATPGNNVSIAQSLHWALRDPAGDRNYTVPRKLSFTSTASVSRLLRAYAALVRRHAALLTRFSREDGIKAHRGRRLPRPIVRDVARAGSPDAVELVVEQWRSENMAFRFDLFGGDLMRVVLLKVSETGYVVLFNASHLIVDGESLNTLWRDFLDHLDAGGRPERPRAIDTFDFYNWEAQFLRSEAAVPALAHWDDLLGGATLPIAYRSALHSAAPFQPVGRVVPLRLDGTAAAGLRQVARVSGTSFYDVCMAMFGRFLCGLVQGSDVLVSTPSANRWLPQTHDLVGYFMNHRIFRLRGLDRMAFPAACAAVARQSVKNELYGFVPFRWKTRRVTGQGRGAAVQFSLLMTELDAGDVAAHQFDAQFAAPREQSPSPYELMPCGNDLELHVLRIGADVRMNLVANASQFSEQAAGQLGAALVEAMQQACHDMADLGEFEEQEVAIGA